MRGKALVFSVSAALFAASVCALPSTALHAAAGTPKISVFAGGLNNPRGLTFGPDGNLYVAEGGTGGTTSSDGKCTQVVAPFGPYTGGFTASISKVTPHGAVSKAATGLPSSQTTAVVGSLTSGVADVKFLNGHLYALISGAGCSHGLNGTSNGIFRINGNGTATMIADLSAYSLTHPVANIDPSDYEPDGSWFSMTVLNGHFFTSNPNHQDLVRASTNGNVIQLLDLSKHFDPAKEDWRGPTAITERNGNLYVGTLNEFPIVVGRSEVLKVGLDSDLDSANIHAYALGLTTILGLAFNPAGDLYVSETSVGPGLPGPGLGQIVRIDHATHHRTVIATGLNVPTGIAFGPHGDDLYVSVNSFGAPAGAGQVLKIDTDNDGD